ncbi:hypothetical protein V2J09_024316 [Rumex salicifolius]
MADNSEHVEPVAVEEEERSFLDKIEDKVHLHHGEEAAPASVFDKEDSSSSSSSDSEHEKHAPEPVMTAPAVEESTSSVKAKVNRLFGREKPVHQVLGGGKPADVFLWRDKKLSAGVLGTATTIWVLFELLEYHLLSLISHILIFSLAVLFLWANVCTFINKSPPRIPEAILPREPILQFASAVCYEINRGLHLMREIALGREVKKFLAVIAGLWLFSILGSCCNFLTLVYIMLHTIPFLYEKHEDKVDSFAERAAIEAKKQYLVVNDKYLSKLPKVPLSKKAA